MNMIQDFVYVPRLGGYKFTALTCAFGVEAQQNDHGVWRRYHQCENRPSCEIGGFRFCTQHRKVIESRMNHAEPK